MTCPQGAEQWARSSDTKHLRKRGTTWSFLIGIPRDLRHRALADVLDELEKVRREVGLRGRGELAELAVLAGELRRDPSKRYSLPTGSARMNSPPRDTSVAMGEEGVCSS